MIKRFELVLLLLCSVLFTLSAAEVHTATEDTASDIASGVASGVADDEAVSSAAGITDQERWIMKYVDNYIEKGDALKEHGFMLQANFCYNQAYVALASFRYSIQYVGKLISDQIKAKEEQAEPQGLSAEDKAALDDFDGGSLSSMLEGLMNFGKGLQKATEKIAEGTEKLATAAGIDLEEEKMEDMNEQLNTFARISIASPFPYLFEGYIDVFLGKKKSAVRNFIYAYVNPWTPEDTPKFFDVYALPLDELREVCKRLIQKEGSIGSKLNFAGPTLDRAGENWMHLYHYAKALLAEDGNPSILKKLESEGQAAIKYLIAAAYAFPFDTEIFLHGAELTKNAGDQEMYEWFIREGMILDPYNTKWNKYFNAWGK